MQVGGAPAWGLIPRGFFLVRAMLQAPGKLPARMGKQDAPLARIAHRSVQAPGDPASAPAAVGVLLAFRRAGPALVSGGAGPRPAHGPDRGGARQVRR